MQAGQIGDLLARRASAFHRVKRPQYLKAARQSAHVRVGRHVRKSNYTSMEAARPHARSMIHLSEVAGDTSGPIGKQVTVTLRGRSAVALYDGRT